VITGAYRDLFAATAGAAAALTGLLFVAMSVERDRALVRGPLVIRQIRASAALLAFTNTLAIALFGLVPGTNIGYPAVIVAVIGVLFTAAAIRSIVASRASPAQVRSQTGLIILLLLICFTELVAGIVVLGNPASSSSVQAIGYAVVAAMLFGIGRAWEFIGERESGILASLGILVGHTDPLRGSAADDGGSEDPGRAGGPTADGRKDPEERDDPPAGDPANGHGHDPGAAGA
jgi:hypothetical protein